ncbi:MAG: hypothetical protein QM658_06355 [Gordonia sp. (in: high G+C Gram-positive bacteria)]
MGHVPTGVRCATVLGCAGLIAASALLTGCDSQKKNAPAAVTVVETKTVGASETPTDTDQAPQTTVTQTQTQTQPATNSAFVGKWMGHTRSLDLNADGSGQVSLFSGAMDGEVWNLQWTSSGDSLTVTIGSQVKVSGSGVGGISQGATWTGSLVHPDTGGTAVLLNNVSYCDNAAGQGGYCGA